MVPVEAACIPAVKALVVLEHPVKVTLVVMVNQIIPAPILEA